MSSHYIDELNILHTNIQIFKMADKQLGLFCSRCNTLDRVTKYDELREEVEYFGEKHSKCSRTEDIIPPGESGNKIVQKDIYCCSCGFPLLDLRQSYLKVYTNHVKLFCTKCSSNTSYTKILQYIHSDVFWIIKCKKFFITDFEQMKFLYDYYMNIRRTRILQPFGREYPTSFNSVLIISNEFKQ